MGDKGVEGSSPDPVERHLASLGGLHRLVEGYARRIRGIGGRCQQNFTLRNIALRLPSPRRPGPSAPGLAALGITGSAEPTPEGAKRTVTRMEAPGREGRKRSPRRLRIA